MSESKRREYIRQVNNELIPQFYAVMSLALHREYGFGTQRLARVIAAANELWGQYKGRVNDLIEKSRDETGIVITWDD